MEGLYLRETEDERILYVTGHKGQAAIKNEKGLPATMEITSIT